MKIVAAFLIALLVLPSSLPVFGQSPELIAPTDPLSPEAQRAMFHLPPGFEIQLIVSEKTIGQPMNLNFDAAGRLWITSSITYPYPTAGEGVQPRDENFGPPSPPPARDWVTVVEDIQPDGTPGKIWRFAKGLNIPIGIVPVQDGTLVYDIPAIRLHQDTDGDGKADAAKRLLWGFGNVDTHGMTNSFTRWIDGWIYACHGFRNTSHIEAVDGRKLTMNSGNTYRFHQDGTGLEQFTWGQVNPFGLTFDPLGNLYSADCHSLPLTMLLRGAYYTSFGKPHDGLGYGPQMIKHLHGSTGICGPVYYAADSFPEEYQNHLYLCNPVTGRVHRDRLIDQGSTRLVDTQPDFITCDDPWFRPVDLKLGPDGCLYLADFYNAIIGHYEVVLKHPKRDQVHGRVWRIVYRGEDGSLEPPPLPDFTAMSAEELVDQLGDANLIVRKMATNELADRIGSAAVSAVRPVFEGTSSPAQRVHAMWVLSRLGELDNEQIMALSQDDSRLVRTHVARMLAERADWPHDDQLVSVLRTLAADNEPFVQRAAVDALGRQARQDSVLLLLAMLDDAPEADTHLRHTIRIALRNQLRGEGGGDAADLAALPPSTTEAHLRTLASISLAVDTEAVGAFLADLLKRYDFPRPRLLEFVRHIARVGTPAALEQTLLSVNARFADDFPFQDQLLLEVREGLTRKGRQPGEFVIRQAEELARQFLRDGGDQAISWRTYALGGNSGNEQSWTVEQLRCQDGQTADVFSTRPRGERATGIYRSSEFVLPATLSFFCAGHCGPPDEPCRGLNKVRLLDVLTGSVIAEANVPRNDTAQRIQWDLSSHQGRAGYLELIDGDSGDAYAWMAVGRFSVAALDPVSFSPVAAAVELIGRFQLDGLTDELRAVLLDQSAPATQRAAAAEALVALQPDARLSAALPFAIDPLVAGELRSSILTVVASRNADEIEKTLEAVMQSLPAPRQEGFAITLAGDREGGEALLQLIERGKASPRLLLGDALKRQLIAARIPNVERRLSELTSGLPSNDEQIAQRIGRHRESFNMATASSQRGREVFEKVCAACHRIGEKGALIGPQLDGVGVRGVDRLLEDLLDPNRNVDGAFRITTLLMADGKVLTGLFRRQEGATLVFADQKGKEFTVQEADIDERVQSPVSLMPTNLYEIVKPEQIDHLLAYLLEQRTAAEKASE